MPKHKLPDKNFIWSANLAYIIGLLATDGNLSKNGRSIIMRSSDIQLLQTFKKCLNLFNKIEKTRNNGWARKPSYRIQFGDVQFYRWLLKIGLFPAKTYTIGKLKIPNQYFRDFIRGHLDGDGSVWTYKDRWNTFKNPKYVYIRLWTRFYSASEIHIQWIREKIIKLIGIKGHIWKRNPLRADQIATMRELKFAKKDSTKLLAWLYYNPDVPCLKRKREIAEKFI
ncbi:MAG: LAGLIDADG family homing endonuclease [bacterium]|nr:LAGLIDADG family homing endonuclease [bacterium]